MIGNCTLCSCSLISFQAGSFRGDAYVGKLGQLEKFASILISRTESQVVDTVGYGGETEMDDNSCCICYAGEADAQFVPCSHRSCYGCITRHLLNCQRCFFCNATVMEVVRISNGL
jgi:Kip1 ubiquitination-promoting complex protein 1